MSMANMVPEEFYLLVLVIRRGSVFTVYKGQTIICWDQWFSGSRKMLFSTVVNDFSNLEI